MGASILSAQNPNSHDHVISPNQSQYRIHLTSAYIHLNPSQVNPSIYLSKDYRFTEQSLANLSREQIVENNFSEQFDPLFTTFRPENKNIYGKFRILCSNITNEKIQQYKIFFQNQTQFRTYLVSYFWRKHYSELRDWPLVKTTNLKLYEESKRMLNGGISAFISSKCSANKQIYCKLYVEDIPLRLCHIKDIPFPENLYVLRQVLKGFHIIYENIGYIKPFEDLICITRKGVIKVWINSDLSKNFPNIENIDENITSTKSESKLINEILHIVMKNTDPVGQPIQFSVFLKEQYVNMEFISFEKIFQMISKYEIQYGIEIPNNFSSIVEVLNQEEEEYDTYRTDMEHGNERVQSSQSIQSQRRSGSGLFLDVPNTSSRMKFNQNNHKKKPSLNNESGMKQNSKKKNKTHKTQSLKIGQKQYNSLESSVTGAKSNILLCESLPISGGMNQQTSSNEINQSGISNKDVRRSRQEQSSSQIKKLNEANFIHLEKQNKREINVLQEESVLTGRESKQCDQEYKHVSRSSIPFGKAQYINSSQELFQKKSSHSIKNHPNNPPYPPFPSTELYALRSNQHLQLYREVNESHHASQDYSVQIHSNNDIRFSESQHASEFFKNKKTYSNLWERKLDDPILLDKDENQPESMVIRVEATEEEMEHMIEIDKFLQAQVLKEEEQKLRLSELYQSSKQLLNKNQQLRRESNNKRINRQIEEHFGLKMTTIPLLPAINNQASSQISSKHEDLSNPHMLTSRQQQFSNSSGVHHNMHSSHHGPYMKEVSSDGLVMNSHIVLRSARGSRQERLSGNFELINPVVLKQDLRLPEVQELETHLTPNSKSSLNPNDQLLFLQHSNTNIEMQAPSTSSRNEQNSSNVFDNVQESQRTSQNILPVQIISALSNQVFVPASHHQLLLNRKSLSPTPALVSSTSIGNSIVGPPAKQVHFPINTIIVSSPLKNDVPRIPKVTFAMKTPDQMSYTNFQSSKTVSINQVTFSQQQIQQEKQSNKMSEYPLGTEGENSSSQNMNRLSFRAQTMVSAYVHSQGGNLSSRKYYEHEESSSYSKPSIVEYSYLKNPQFFGNVQHGQAEIRKSQNSKIPERSLENSVEKIPLSAEFIQQEKILSKQQEASFKRPQINHQYTYHSGHHEPQLLDIVPIPEEMQSEMFNNSRSFVNNDDLAGHLNVSDSIQRNDHPTSSENMQPQFSEQKRIPFFVHQKQSSGFKAVESEKQEHSLNQPKLLNQQHSQHRKQSYFVSEEFSHCNEDQMRSEFSNHHPQMKINVRPSYESMSGCSERENQLFSNKSYVANSNKENRSSFFLGQEKSLQTHLIIVQKTSDQGSYQNEQVKSGYRVVESIQENRPNSSYQMEIDVLDKQGDSVNMDQKSSKIQDKRQLMANFSNRYNSGSQKKDKEHYQKEFQSPTESQKLSPRINRLPKKPVTGRTMFMNNQNQLMSQFIDPESELQSEVDYTYNSYDKWKDKSKVVDFGPSRFKEFDEKGDEDGELSNRKFNNPVFDYPERHGNHKQLVKSSIEGMKLLHHHFNRSENFNTDKKELEMKEKHDSNQQHAYQLCDEHANQLYNQTFSPQNRMELTGFRMASESQEEEIDQEILNDLKDV